MNSWMDWLESNTARRCAIALFITAAIFYAAFPIANNFLGKSIKDYQLWHDVGEQVVRGEQIYPAGDTKFDFMYPPPAALLLAPVSMLGKSGTVIALALGNIAAWLACILLAARLVVARKVRGSLLVYLMPSVLVCVFIWSNFHIGQPSMLLLALMLGAFLALQSQRNLVAGAFIALAAAIKAFPLLALIYLLYRRYWIAAASLVLALTFLVVILPTPFRGFRQARDDLKRWSQGMLFKYDDKGVAQRPGRSNSWKNQSIVGLANRLLRHVDADDEHRAHTPRYANLINLRFSTVNRLILAAIIALGLIYLAVMPARAARTEESDALEFALLLLLMLMVTPMTFGYLFVWLLYPFAVIVRRLLTRGNLSLGIGLGGALFLLALSIPWQRTAQTYGNYFFASLLLFGVLALDLWRLKSAPLEDRGEPARGED